MEPIGYGNYRAADSLDQFLPLVNLHVEENQTPKYALIHLYAILQVVVGWLIVPLSCCVSRDYKKVSKMFA